ncbi:MAG: hypothetical protein LBR26_07690 [Prevotella sp.]|jgi:hypothetical protein|nr:hypothetical protein [Prevotella sp.]
MKTHAVLFYFLFPALLASCIEHPVEYKIVATISKVYKTNILGIAGQASEEPYVEIIYSVANGTDKNVTKHIMVAPPYIFENENVNIVCDSAVDMQDDRILTHYLILKHDYEEGGAEYFRIINHSTDKPIEFFIAGCQDIKTIPGTVDEVEILPSIYYRKAPVYYLLFPDKKYRRNLKNGADIFYFEANRCGDIELTSAWSVDEVMELYRAEYRLSTDTILHVDLWGGLNSGRMAKPAEHSKPRLENRTFYGVIPPKSQFKGDEKFWLLATPWIFQDEYIVRERF